MRALRVATEIRPIGLRRIRAVGPHPGDGFTPGGRKRANPPCQGIARIGGDKFVVALQRVALQRHGIGILCTKIADRPVPDRRDLIGRRLRRRIGPAIEEHEARGKLLRVPRHLRALARVIDAQPHAVEQFRQRQPAGSDHLRQRQADFRGGHRAGDGHQHLSAAIEMADVIIGCGSQRRSVEMPIMLLNEVVNRTGHRARMIA